MKAKVPGCTYRRVTCTHARTCGSALEVFIASVLETLATTTGDALERKVVTSSLSLPWAAAPMIRWISTWFHCSFHLLSMFFLIGLNVYLMTVLHAVWIQEHLDQVDKAFRWRQPAIIFVFRSFISQTKHMAEETPLGLCLMTLSVRTCSMCSRAGNTEEWSTLTLTGATISSMLKAARNHLMNCNDVRPFGK